MLKERAITSTATMAIREYFIFFGIGLTSFFSFFRRHLPTGAPAIVLGADAPGYPSTPKILSLRY
jgi:hypothetical protein